MMRLAAIYANASSDRRRENHTIASQLAAARHVEAVLVCSPDRLTRRYAFQVLPANELSRGGNRRAGLWACCGSKGPGPRFRQ